MQFAQFRGAFIWIVFLVLWYVPLVSNLFWGLIFFISKIIGVPLTLAAMGLDQFQFWR
jgi:hypothetical protein